jgi:hypothetical protein
VLAGFVVRPVWASERWIVVLVGDDNQWNRSPLLSLAIGPAAASPAATRRMASSSSCISSESPSGASAASLPTSRPVRAPRNRLSGQKSTTPALMYSPRSTRGTARRTVYAKGLRAGSGTLGLLRYAPVCRQPLRQVIQVRGPMRRRIRQTILGCEPVIGNGGHDPLE